uniref:Small ribosomal subunit protein uS4c n=1 Tax=Selaginella tamariscina TaxID=137178 RepID=A0A482CH73_9TRAC|nr:ribosomal protein S4 [Selaginella tamariscina]YP_009589856.1 ribosomal protein S4 [Selaginella tamariscina]QBL76403.1 ribosomal protein S4 [Selaginella tamariscina]QBL76439.1 ribosomal protein S4 [Selaginella tamariscina]
MSRHRGPRVKIVRRPGRSPGSTQKKPNKKPSYANQSTSTTKAPQYRIRLEEKQRLRLHYGLTEQQLLRYVRIARRAKGPTGQVSLQSPETRSDNIASRLGMAPTVPGARQLVTHKHVLVNDHAVNTPSHRRKPTDVTAVKQPPGCRGGAGNSLNRIGEQEDSTPHPRARSAVQLMDRKWIDPNINELLVVEYHPRQAQ